MWCFWVFCRDWTSRRRVFKRARRDWKIYSGWSLWLCCSKLRDMCCLIIFWIVLMVMCICCYCWWWCCFITRRRRRRKACSKNLIRFLECNFNLFSCFLLCFFIWWCWRLVVVVFRCLWLSLMLVECENKFFLLYNKLRRVGANVFASTYFLGEMLN